MQKGECDLATIKYEIDTTEGRYVTFEGKTLQELEEFLYKDQIFKDCCGYITYQNGNQTIDLSIAALKDYGVYLGYAGGDEVWLSLFDQSKLCSVLDVWGDGLYVSEGLFIDPAIAWSAICEFVETGSRSQEIPWMSYDDFPEEGNCLF